MTPTQTFQNQAKRLIDDLKSVCHNYGLGNDGNEFKIITQIFLYKFLNDKFAHEAKKLDPALAAAPKWEEALAAYSPEQVDLLLLRMGGGTAQLKPRHFISALYKRQNEENFAQHLDDTLQDIAALNSDIFSVVTDDKEKIVLFDRVTEYVSNKRNEFARALINKLLDFSFESIFAEKFDFYATLFEYLIKDYNKDGGGLQKFDYIVSNPPFKLDFSDFRDQLDTKANRTRFFAGIPKVSPKSKDKMAIYLLFLQHIIYSLAPKGKAAVVVPTGFITAQSGIDKKIRQHLVENKMLAGVVSMPSNIFATTGTNVSILFLDDTNKGKVILIDASGLGTKVKDGKNQKTLLSTEEEDKIIRTFNRKETVDDFSVTVSYDEITEKNYSLSAGQYFDVKIDYVDISPEEFQAEIKGYEERLKGLFGEAHNSEKKIHTQIKSLRYDSRKV